MVPFGLLAVLYSLRPLERASPLIIWTPPSLFLHSQMYCVADIFGKTAS